MKQRTFLHYMLVSFICGVLCLWSSEIKAKQAGDSGRQARKENGHERRERFEDASERVIQWRELNLSREQKEHVKHLRRDFQIATAGLRKELALAEHDLQAEFRHNIVDREKIDRMVQDISVLKRRLSEAATENFLELKALLNLEQQSKLAALQVPLPEELGALLLSEEQQTQIRMLLKMSIRHRRKLSGELRELRSDLRDLLLAADVPEATQLKELQAQIAAQELAMERARVDNLLDIRDILSPEQLDMLIKGDNVTE